MSRPLAAHKLRLRPLADPLSSAACDFPRIQRATDRYSEPGLFPPGRRLPVGLSRAHRRPRVHPPDRARRVLRCVHGQPGVERVPGDPGPGLRPALRARLPARPGRGEAGRDLPPEAGRGGSQGPDRPPPAHDPEAEERQARRLHRRRSRVAHGRERPAAARLRGRHPRAVGNARRADAHQHSRLPPAGDRACRGDRLHHRDGRRDPLRPARRQPEEAARHRRFRCRVRRQRRAEGQGARSARAQGRRRQHPHRHPVAGVDRVRPPRQDRRAGAHHRRRQHRDGLLPLLAASRRQRTSR